MKYIIYLIVFLNYLSSAAHAEVIKVRSGEHRDFTRFVFQIPLGTGWAIDSKPDGFAVSIEIDNVEYDLSDAFTRIPRSRVVELRQRVIGEDLRIITKCKCNIRSFIEGTRLLVVDVFDGPTIQPPSDLRLPIYGLPYKLPKTWLSLYGPNQESSAPETKRNSELTPDAESEQISALPLPDGVRQRLAPEIPFAARSGLFEQRLNEQIERAAKQSLIEKDRSVDRNGVSHTEEGTSSRNETPGLYRDADNHLNVGTTIDRDLEQIASVLEPTGHRVNCLPNEAVAIHTWATQAPYASQIATWRRALVEEFDRVDEDKLLKLAKTYIYFGFGAEARQTLSLSSNRSDEVVLLDALAAILDGDEVDKSPFKGQAACAQDVALWALLSDPNASSSANSNAILRALGRLPVHIREQVGPELSQIFSAAGKPSLAEAMLRNLTRLTDESSPAVKMAQALALDMRGEEQESEKNRQAVIEANVEDSPVALMQIIEQAYTDRSTIRPKFVDLIAAYSTEFRRSELGDELQSSTIVALALSGNFKEATDLLNTSNDQEVRWRVLTLLTERANNLDFLKFGLNLSSNIEDQIPIEIGNSMSKRLLELGFAKPAEKILSAAPGLSQDSERRLLRARAFIGVEMPNQALDVLLNLNGKEAAQLRADAMLQLQEFSQAAEYFLEGENEEAASRSFWLTDRRGSISDESGVYSEIVELTNELTQDSSQLLELSPLARARALIEDSKNARSEAENLLEITDFN